MQQISLEALLPADFDPTTCKLHCAVFNGKEHPIDVLANDPVEWQGWNSWRAGKNDFRLFAFQGWIVGRRGPVRLAGIEQVVDYAAVRDAHAIGRQELPASVSYPCSG